MSNKNIYLAIAFTMGMICLYLAAWDLFTDSDPKGDVFRALLIPLWIVIYPLWAYQIGREDATP